MGLPPDLLEQLQRYGKLTGRLLPLPNVIKGGDHILGSRVCEADWLEERRRYCRVVVDEWKGFDVVCNRRDCTEHYQ